MLFVLLLFHLLFDPQLLFTGGKGGGTKARGKKPKPPRGKQRKQKTKKTKAGGGSNGGPSLPSLPGGAYQAAKGMKMGYKGAKKGYKAGKKGAKGTKKGVKAGVRAGREAARAREWEKRRRLESTVEWTWKMRKPAEIDDNVELEPIPALPLSHVDMSFPRPLLAHRSRRLNERLRKDWKYLVDEDNEPNFSSERFGATFLFPVGWKK